jgi:putative membrane protein
MIPQTILEATMPDLNALASIPLADRHGPGWWIVFVPLGWFAVAFLFFFLFRRAGSGPGCWGGGYGRAYGGGWRRRSAPIEVLDRRFAEGEIDAEEYGARRSTLEKWDPGADSDR